jgi:hypothetical protein
MDRTEDLPRRIREPRDCVELLLAAPHGTARSVAPRLGAVLFSLPAVHRKPYLKGTHRWNFSWQR